MQCLFRHCLQAEHELRVHHLLIIRTGSLEIVPKLGRGYIKIHDYSLEKIECK